MDQPISQNKKWLTFTAISTYILLVGLGFYLLATSQSNSSLVTPWQTIRHPYIYAFFLSTLLLGLLIAFSKLKSSNLLILLIFHSLLLHSYLPLTHQLLYGADQWRHIAVESRIMQGLPHVSATLSDGTTGSVLGNLIGRVSYSSMWYVSVGKALFVQAITHWDTATSLIFVSKWLQVLWWSLTVPILLFFLGRALQWDERKSLFLSWLGFLPFAFSYAGSVLIPVSFGFPIFLLGIVLLLNRIQKQEKKYFWWLLAVGMVMLFGYVLYAVLFWVGWLVVEVMRSRKYQVASGKYAIVLLIFTATVLPLLELVGHYTNLNLNLNLSTTLRTIVSNFTIYDLARGPIATDYLNGNIIFNQVPSYAFVQNIFTIWRWWIPPFIIGFWITCIFGVKSLWRQSANGKWLVIFGGGLFVNYIVSRYFLSGEQILTRRLDTTLALFFIVYFAAGVFEIMRKLRNNVEIMTKYFLTISSLFLIIISIAITASYSLGPDTQTVSVDEYHAMQYVWSQDKHEVKHCVIADTYPLLALEAISDKQIVGGGFPISQYFGQPERTTVLSRIHSVLRAQIQEVTLPTFTPDAILSSFDHCWYVGDIVSDSAADYVVKPIFPHKTNAMVFGSLQAAEYSKDW